MPSWSARASCWWTAVPPIWTVLCAEDNALNAEILEVILEMYGASCTICPDGAELVKAFEMVKPGESTPS